MKTIARILIVPAIAAACAFGVVGCDDDDTEMEEIGENVGDKMDDAGEAIDEAANDAKRGVEDAMD